MKKISNLPSYATKQISSLKQRARRVSKKNVKGHILTTNEATLYNKDTIKAIETKAQQIYGDYKQALSSYKKTKSQYDAIPSQDRLNKVVFQKTVRDRKRQLQEAKKSKNQFEKTLGSLTRLDTNYYKKSQNTKKTKQIYKGLASGRFLGTTGPEISKQGATALGALIYLTATAKNTDIENAKNQGNQEKVAEIQARYKKGDYLMNTIKTIGSKLEKLAEDYNQKRTLQKIEDARNRAQGKPTNADYGIVLQTPQQALEEMFDAEKIIKEAATELVLYQQKDGSQYAVALDESGHKVYGEYVTGADMLNNLAERFGISEISVGQGRVPLDPKDKEMLDDIFIGLDF